MTEVQALTGFEHYGSRKKHERFECSTQEAESLRNAGLVRIISERPETPAGDTSSASPAGPASPGNKSKRSARGGSKTKQTKQEDSPVANDPQTKPLDPDAEASSSPTPASK